LQEPNLGKTNHRVIRSISLVDLFSPTFLDSIIFLTLTLLVVVFKVYKFQICLFTPSRRLSHREPKQCLEVGPSTSGTGGSAVSAATASSPERGRM
jgi:hypothetical protein